MRFKIDLNDRQAVGIVVKYGESLQQFVGCALMLSLGVPSLRKISTIQELGYCHFGGESLQSTTTLSRLMDKVRAFASEMWPDSPKRLFAAQKCGCAISFESEERRVCQSILSTLEEIRLVSRGELDERSQVYRCIWETIR